jgi:hypothetical protein
MKAYICDSCGMPITDPYKSRMLVYTYKNIHPDPDHQYKKSERRKKRLKYHFCGWCMAHMREMCEKASKERSEGK